METGTDRPRFEVADVVRMSGHDFRSAYTPSLEQEAVLRHIAQCRTAALGGHVDECDSCEHQRVSYNSCRDRHCPKCLNTKRAEWLAQRLDRLLPVPYFHVVFTIPEELNPLVLGNRKVMFDLLFAAASRTLLEIAADPEHLGAQIGFTAVLHTWGQNLCWHPHVHCVVTGGGLSPDGLSWIPGYERFLLPVKVLGRRFRSRFLGALANAREKGQLQLGGSVADLDDPDRWLFFKDPLYRKDWNVYAKPPFGGPEHVFAYLGRYTHRIAISNRRITDVSDGQVSFTYKDYRDDGETKVLTLDAIEFLRRFLLHVLPPSYVRIRHFGLCAGANVHGKLETARLLLVTPGPTDHGVAAPSVPVTTSGADLPWWERFRRITGIDVMACPSCSAGRLVRRQSFGPFENVVVLDTS